ncbi:MULTISPECIES: flagellin [unclassified Uliginosibacterium]|jgi:flagellin|uniref:flagellin N-terminal helical domain-containing protein n=1 Tax=unclassified Uliginosibacterium TaxID=2621521 RepID=UPI000C79CB92|nr:MULTISPECIES: flagellin [unclassified Uliginosibacterium]MDO6385106.1 flagellin [Uliginosibacterium sp. 31-12]PLK48783.1 flagellin FliC [Uliginosibacterium sp. TH139]
MAMTINTNVPSLNAQRNLSGSQASLSTSLQRLSSGLRINSAKDDAAGLAVAERIQAQVRGFTVAVRNANDAISLMQVADGGSGQIADNIQRMRELAIQAANGTLNSGDRANLQVEFAALGSEVQRLSQATKFNNVPLLNSAVSTFTFQVGAGTTQYDQISVSTADLRASALAIDSSVINVAGSTGSNALAAITNLDSAINTITTTRAGFGAALNRAQAVISSLQIAVENQSAARGRIVDADFAQETANLSRTQILQQAGTAMLAQANALPQQVLQLLQG